MFFLTTSPHLIVRILTKEEKKKHINPLTISQYATASNYKIQKTSEKICRYKKKYLPLHRI